MLTTATEMYDTPIQERLGFKPGKLLRLFGMRRSGNHAIANWLQRNAPEEGALFLNNCRRGQHPLFHFASAEVNGVKVSTKKALRNLHKVTQNLRDGALVMISYESLSPKQNPAEKPLGGNFAQNEITQDVVIYRGFLNWIASLTKKLENNVDYSVVRRFAVLMRSVDLYSDMIDCVASKKEVFPLSYDAWSQNEDYRSETLGKLALPVTDNDLGEVSIYGGGSSFQKGAAGVSELRTQQRWQQMLSDKLYQNVLQVSACDPLLEQRVSKVFPSDANVLRKVASGASFSPEALQ